MNVEGKRLNRSQWKCVKMIGSTGRLAKWGISAGVCFPFFTEEYIGHPLRAANRLAD
jgi:hypothetical protein